MGALSTATSAPSCEFILVHVHRSLHAANSLRVLLFQLPSYPCSFELYWNCLPGCLGRWKVLCNLPCPLLPSAGDRWSLLVTDGLCCSPFSFRPQQPLKHVTFGTFDATVQWRKSFVLGHHCALEPGPLCDQSYLFQALACYLNCDSWTDNVDIRRELVRNAECWISLYIY